VGHIKGLTEGEEGLQIFPKPAPGSWTEAFGLDTGPMSLRDIYDPEFYELEREAVFRRSWLFIGRVEQLPRNGSYFVKELPFLDVSVLVARGMDGEVRAFHNVCSHRGNKLVWSDRPAEESHGLSRQFACKYHGWRFDLDGQVSYVHNAPEFFDLESADLTLTTIHCEVWSGFVFINLDKSPRQSLREYLTPPVAALEDFPYEKMTELYQLDAVVNSNWKVYIDAYCTTCPMCTRR
jgi:phenylpropionate dioxygenase-like ring-hydroxylating dioxygenase large terminal subunit